MAAEERWILKREKNSEENGWNKKDMNSERDIGALVLAAGRSRRMGDFKPFLPIEGRTVIETVVAHALEGGAAKAVVVTGYRGDEVEELLRSSFSGRVTFARNDAYASTDMMNSVRTGTAYLSAYSAFFLIPGDMPMIRPDTFRRLMEERSRYSLCGRGIPPVIFPSLEGRRKHPPLIDSSMIPEILSFRGEEGLRGLWKEHEGQIVNVPVDDMGTVIDLDTPEDYRRIISHDSCRRS